MNENPARRDIPAVVFFDVDGTLIWHDPAANAAQNVANARPSESVARAFARLRERGHLTFICTGRPRNLVSDDLLALDPTGLVTSAGACVTMGGETVYEKVIDPELLERTVRWLTSAGAEVLFEGSSCLAALMPNGGVYTDIPGAVTVRSWDELSGSTDLRFSKFSYTSETFPVIATMPDDLRCEYGFYDLGLGAGETGMKGVDKAYGVRRVLDRLGRGTERTFAFGDSENDLPMLDAVETAVAMGNAMEVVKQRADYVTDPVADDGVVSGLAHFGLI